MSVVQYVNREYAQLSPKVEKELFTLYSDYPTWVGTTEILEEGKWYEYRMDWKDNRKDCYQGKGRDI